MLPAKLCNGTVAFLPKRLYNFCGDAPFTQSAAIKTFSFRLRELKHEVQSIDAQRGITEVNFMQDLWQDQWQTSSSWTPSSVTAPRRPTMSA